MLRILRSEKEIINSWEDNSICPLVSICCITFNHEKYIEDTLEGFLIQDTDFAFEILIHDDASTDRTAEIICEYHKRYPKIIKPIYQIENQYSKGIRPNLEFNYPRAKGKYIAMCEGDDYWIDSKKLQKQIKFLDEHKDFIATYHKVQIVNENNEQKNVNLNIYKLNSKIFTKNEIEKDKLPGQLGSIVYRNIWRDLNEETKELYKSLNVSGDRKLALILVLEGKIYCFSEEMSAYRRVVNEGASWTARNLHKNLSFKRYKDLLELENFANRAYHVNLNYKQQRLNAFSSAIIFFLKHPNKKNWNIIRNIMQIKVDKLYELIFGLILRSITWPFRKIKRKLVNK